LHRAFTDPATVSIDRVIPPVPARLSACATVGVVTAMLGAVLTVPAAEAHEPPLAAAHTVEHGENAAPLEVSIDTLTPSTVPRRGRVTVTGEITNRSETTWTDLNVYLLMSDSPITSSTDLARANNTDPATEVGARLTAQGLYDEVDDLDPGDSTGYRLSVPRRMLLATQPGVYWLGVHVLGTNDDGRVDGADGRARTYLPLMGARGPEAELSLVFPVREEVRRRRDGTLANVRAWTRRLGEDGRLGRVLDLAGSAGDVPLTWVLDPAVAEAARDLSEGNPDFDLSPTDSDGTGGDAEPEAPVSESPDGEDEPEEELGEVSEEAQVAQDWLDGFTEQAVDDAVYTVPYGDADVAALLRDDFVGLYDRATTLSAATVEELGLDAQPVVAPPDGLLPNVALPKIPPETPLLLSEAAADTDHTMIRTGFGHDTVLTSPAARIGGPTPASRFDALALRQRILAEAAVHALTDAADQPLVVTMPDAWDPGGDWRTASFFPGLDVPWLRTTGLPAAMVTTSATAYDEPLTYSRADVRRELRVANMLTSEELDATGAVLADLLSRNDTIDDEIGKAAMLASSFHARQRPHRYVVMARRISGEVHDLLEQVYVDGSELITLSSETGSFALTVVNDLEEPVTVGITAHTGTDELEISSPDLVSLGPGQRASVRLSVTATDTGVHSVRVVPTTRDGRPLGRSTRIKVRSSQVGLVIWLVIGTGAAVFVVAIGLRIVRRVRARKRTHGPVLKGDTP
jgi:hypothetical protein